MTQRTETQTSARNRTASSKAKATRKRAADRNKRRRRLLMENLEGRRLLAAGPGGTTAVTPQIDSSLFADVDPRNVGTVPSFVYNEAELNVGDNDTLGGAELLPLGTGSGQENTIDVTGTLPITRSPQGNPITDLDIYAFDLRAGDILDIATFGSVANLTVLNDDGSLWFGTDTNEGVFHPESSPLMTTGNAVAAQVVPETGRYYLALAPTTTTSTYQVGLRAYRPVAESLPIGAQQTIYLNFEGGVYPSNLFGDNPFFGIVRFSSLRQNLGALGLQNVSDAVYDDLIDQTVAQVEAIFQSVARDGGNGDYDASGTPGEFGIRILNSRDTPPGSPGAPAINDPLTTHLFIGGTAAEAGVANPIAQTLDIGNFEFNDFAVLPIDGFLGLATQFPIANGSSVVDATARALAWVISHEAGHTFGLRHTDGNNAIGAIMEDPGVRRDEFIMGIGFDGIFGTIDDTTAEFTIDEFSLDPLEGLFGFQDAPNSLAWALSTGTIGNPITGTVFNDANRDGSSLSDVGIAGATVFADLDGDLVLDPTDPVAVTDVNGDYSLNVAPGLSYTIVAVTPNQFASSTPTVQLGVAAGAAGIDFGFTQVIPDVTGTKFADTNGNGVFDVNESGLEGVFIYLDLDGDDRPDLGEPSAVTGEDGSYSINFPGPGTYTIREVVQAGFIQTFPGVDADFEHTVIFDGNALTDNFNFGNLPSRDYGDAPDTYFTTVGAGGPSHGVSTALGLGENVDRETNGIPSADALGDDTTNIDDEDGVELLSPLGPGGDATLRVTTRNTDGTTAFLQGWIDFNINGTFDAGEQVFTDLALGDGTTDLTVSVPADAATGATYARFRYSPTPGLDVGGEADLGEVEDYQFDILVAAEIANDDEFTVARNSVSNQLDVLANDFETDLNTLTIIGRDTNGTAGNVTIAGDGRSIFYTPPNGFTGRDVFQYIVRDQFGNDFSAEVVVNVNFQSNVPIAVDDTFEIPQGSANRALNVLDNDVPSIAGGLSITSVSAGDQGGQVTLEGGGQTIRYTPQPGFAGTEQFTYSIQDSNGAVSTAEVTVNSLPGALNDDLVEFIVEFFDVTNNQPISNVQVGDDFLVRVSVNELNNPNFSPEGVASAFLDLLYTDELVTVRDTMPGDQFGFDIEFGENFQGGGFKLGDANTPGLINDVGAVQPIPGDGNLIEHSDPAELFTLTMSALSPGVAIFASDPADRVEAETILVGENVALTPSQQRLGRNELTIFPAGDDFASAIDDAFVNGTDSDGAVISAGNAPNRLDVLANDNFGPTGSIREFGIATAPTLGTLVLNDNGTPGDPNDDFLDYFADVGANGFDSFTYLIESSDGVRSVAEVTMAIGSAGDDDIVEISFATVDQFGNPITSVASGETFGLQVLVTDLRTALDNTAVFAGYLDILYDIGVISPADGVAGGRYDFDVVFDSDFDEDGGVGTSVRNGIIDEFGAFLLQSVAEDPDAIVEPNLMATVFFVAGSVTSTTQTQIIGSPADAFPFQDTLLIDRDDPVDVSQIRYNSLSITVTPASTLTNPAMAEDVNNDGAVTPSDALGVINALARAGEGEFAGTGMYTDVNGDTRTTAIDALQVINYLAVSAAGGGAESEQVAIPLTSSGSATSSSSSVDEAIADLSSPSKLSSGSAAGGESGGSMADFLDSSDDDDDDSLALDLLASDQSSL